jgi:peptide deformylase
MSVKEILKMGHPVLRDKAQPVTEFNSPALASLLEDMIDTMQALNGAGLAAPQIGVSLRVVIFAVESNPRYPDAEPIPQTILINPEIFPLAAEQEAGWEGCLSIPGMRGLVPRYQHIRYRGYNQHGEAFEREVHDFHARVVQHEVDHLDGILYPQRIKDLTHLGFEQDQFPPV